MTGEPYEHSVVSRTHDQDPADDCRADEAHGRGVRDSGRQDSPLQPESRRGGADGGKAEADGPQPH